MGLVLENTSLEVFSYVIVTLWLIYWYLTKSYDYWNERGVPCCKAEFPFGSTREIALTKTFIGKAHDNIYKQFLNERFYGILEFRKPTLVVKDPELIKKIMVNDFSHFVDRPTFINNPKEYINLHLLNLVGQEWKDMRAKLTPTFTSGKMKSMFKLMENCSKKLKDQLETETKQGNVVDAKNILARFTMEIIASCAFGLETNSITEKNTEFFRILGGTMKTTKIRFIRRFLLILFPFLIKVFRINIVRPHIRDFITKIVRDTIEYRNKNNVKRNDFLDLLINVKHNKSFSEENDGENCGPKNGSPEGLTMEQMSAQTFVFFIAGFETASSLMSFCLFELSCHKDIQEKLYREIQKVLNNNEGRISYQMLMEMTYLDQVINETLRLYGTAHVLSRVCTQTYKIPHSDLVLEKGLKVIIPLFSLHHDPKYYPDPYTFRPERFTSEEIKNRHPFVFMPFGEGPRHCIGMRFGLIQAKLGLATIILNFQVDLSPDQEDPIEIDKRSFVIMPANPVLLKFVKRQQ